LTKKHDDKTVFSPGKARWLLENVEKLDENERALLLAMAELAKDEGRQLTEEERVALDKLAAETREFNPSEIQGAVHKMVEDKPKHKPDQDWSDVSRKLKQAKKK
jgi:hypothetical protein